MKKTKPKKMLKGDAMGTKCEDCYQDMQTAESCSFFGIVIRGKRYKRDTEYFDEGERCHDCGIVNRSGNVHHYGCDMERCPKCKGQLIGCGCFGDSGTVKLFRGGKP